MHERMRVQCSRCKARSPVGTEYDTEVWFSAHKCKGKRDLSVLSLALLRRVATGEISEQDAWKIHDEEKTS